MGKYEIVTSGIGNPDDILKMKSVDKLPYRLQKKIFLPIIGGLEDRGLNLVKTRRCHHVSVFIFFKNNLP